MVWWNWLSMYATSCYTFAIMCNSSLLHWEPQLIHPQTWNCSLSPKLFSSSLTKHGNFHLITQELHISLTSFLKDEHSRDQADPELDYCYCCYCFSSLRMKKKLHTMEQKKNELQERDFQHNLNLQNKDITMKQEWRKKVIDRAIEA